MSRGSTVKIKLEWQLAYRSPGAAVAGVLVGVSPSGLVGRVRMDERGDFHVLLEHLDPAAAGEDLAG